MRAAALSSPPSLPVLRNPGFELPPGANGQIPGWLAVPPLGVSVQLDAQEKHLGKQSLRLFSNGPEAHLMSDPFQMPPTGRIAVAVWLRVADAARQPPLRLAIDAKLGGEEHYRFAPLGKGLANGPAVVPLAAGWGQYIFQANDLPLEGLSQVRVRFDLMGAGEVWIDDVQVFDLSFTRDERVELSKMIALANVKLQNGQTGDCLRLLEGYWPRFLESNMPLPVTPAEGLAGKADAPPKTDGEAPEESPERSGLLDRMKDLIPKPLRF
jgi:hypothetical protein